MQWLYINNVTGGRARSWIWELTETLFKFIFASAQQRSPSNIPINPNSEVLPLTKPDKQLLTDSGWTPENIPALFN